MILLTARRVVTIRSSKALGARELLRVAAKVLRAVAPPGEIRTPHLLAPKVAAKARRETAKARKEARRAVARMEAERAEHRVMRTPH